MADELIVYRHADGLPAVQLRAREATVWLTQAEIADGWQLLFDGKSLDQWKDFNGDSLTMPWHVVDGCIQAAGDGSDEGEEGGA